MPRPLPPHRTDTPFAPIAWFSTATVLTMFDALLLVLGTGFFFLMAGYAALCERI